jgi:hypothetical protein
MNPELEEAIRTGLVVNGGGFQEAMEAAQRINNVANIRNPNIRRMRDDAEAVKRELKLRHLNGTERARNHQPVNDWKSTDKGDVCISASTLCIDDILSKFPEEVNSL